MPRPLVGAACALFAYLAFQLMPLSPDRLAELSPAASRLRQTIDVLPRADTPPMPAGEDVPIDRSPRAFLEITNRAASAIRQYAAPPTVAVDRFAAEAELRCYLALALAFWLAATLPHPNLLLRALVASGVAMSGLAIVENAAWNGKILWFFLPYEGGSYYPRMMGPFVNADHFAMFLELALLPAVALLFQRMRQPERERRRRGGSFPNALAISLLAISVALMVAALVGSASRGGIVGSLLGAFVLWAGLRRKRTRPVMEESVAADDGAFARRRRRGSRLDRVTRVLRPMAPALMVMALLAGGLLYAGSGARGRLDVRLGQTILTPDIDFRVDHWKQTLPILDDYRIFGVGLRGWRQVFGRYQRYPIVGYPVSYVHNDYLEWACEVGVVGIALTLALAAAYVHGLWSRSGAPREVRFGIYASLVAIAWHEFFDFGLRMPANALLLSVLLGLLCNEGWKADSPSEGTTNPPRRLTAARALVYGIATVLAGVMCLANVRQFREFVQWRKVHEGSIDLELTPRNPDTWYELGKRLAGMQAQETEAAGACFRAAIAERPTQAWAVRRLASTESDPDAQLKTLDRAIFLQPTQAEWRLAKALLLEAKGDAGGSLAEVEEAVHRSPLLEEHSYLRADNSRLTSSVLDAADRGFHRALDEQPTNAKLLAEAAEFHHRFGSPDEAARLWIRAAESADDWAKYGKRAAEDLAAAGELDRAEEVARAAISRNPTDAEGYRVLAMSVLRAKGKYKEAREVLENGVRRSKRPADVYLSLYDLAHEQKNTKEALAALAKAADILRRDAMMQFYLGFAYLDAGDDHRSVIAFDRAIALDKGHAEFYYYKGFALERRLDLAGALANYQAAASREPGNAGYVASVARISAQLAAGGHDEAGERASSSE